MKGTVLTTPETFKEDDVYLEFILRLPHPNRNKNDVHILLRQDYEYIPSKGDTVEIFGNPISYDLGKDIGIRLYLTTVVIYPAEGVVSPEENVISVRGTLKKAAEVYEKNSHKVIARFAILPDSNNRTRIPVYCFLEGDSAHDIEKYNIGTVLTLKGRLISRNFDYKGTRRSTTELLVLNYAKASS